MDVWSFGMSITIMIVVIIIIIIIVLTVESIHHHLDLCDLDEGKNQELNSGMVPPLGKKISSRRCYPQNLGSRWVGHCDDTRDSLQYE